MTIDELSRLAYSGTPPDGASQPEWLLYYRLKEIYASVRSGGMSKADGAKAKQDAVSSYETDKTLHDASVKLWARIEQSGTRYAKDKTIDNADAFYAAVYGVRAGGRTERDGDALNGAEPPEQGG